jgi:response regulator of citrate/malate metabolism
MEKFTTQSFFSEYKVSVVTARQYLNALVESGRARAVKEPVQVSFNGKKVATKKIVTTYRSK